MDISDTADQRPALNLAAIMEPGTPSAVLVVEVKFPRLTETPGWETGPLPLAQVRNATTQQRSHSSRTDGDARRTLVAGQQSDVLYGTQDLPTRFHKLVHNSGGDPGPIWALELLRAPTGGGDEDNWIGWLALHVTAQIDGRTHQDAIPAHRTMMSEGVRGKRADSDLWKVAGQLLPPPVEVLTDAHVRTLSFQSLNCHNDPDLSKRALIAAYLLITTAASDQQVSDMSSRAHRHSLTVERSDWSALVLREGAAFIGHQRSAESFTDVVRVQTHTIHLDALLLALLQRSMVDASGSRTIDASLDSPEELVELERRHYEFKRKYWRTSLTHKRNSPSDHILRAFQAELLTALDVAEVQERVKDGAQLSRSLNAESQNRSAKKLTNLVQHATIVIGALGLAFTAAPVVADPSWRLFVVAGATGIVAMAVALLILQLTGRTAESGVTTQVAFRDASARARSKMRGSAERRGQQSNQAGPVQRRRN